ncbi:hypothetical protein AKJ37_02205 [candidate division MSBL1 archaeon SCGC-AAA259I09]|uniref:Uncharacterized protein n=1 Tax=candidate division MSBL1 archaeon SCGC-AAA259I09 TaxID=1698267 RepID=A0A133UUN0_9EURY|nr:hypothetical protein AKJ37_02205 [candidate division MSBL1 archaeon SCGC-AAA259I09]
MSRFKAECPIERCDFETRSFWMNVAKGGIITHIYRTNGNGHGPKGSTPERDLKIEVRRIDGK